MKRIISFIDFYKLPVYLAVSLLMGLVSAFFVYFPLTDSDIWWHLATARHIVTTKSLPLTDPFSFTSTNAPWINLHWLFQLFSYLVYSAGGAACLVIMKCLIVFIVCIILGRAVPSRGGSILIMSIVALLIFEARYLVLIRPVLITILCMAVFIVTFETYRRTNKISVLFILPLVQIIWTNSQGLFLLSLGITCPYLFESFIEAFFLRKDENSKKQIAHISLITVLIAASFLVNPYGYHSLTFPLKLLERIIPSSNNIYSLNISENIPLIELLKTDSRLVYAVLFTTSLAFFSFAMNTENIRVSHFLMFLIFGVLAFMAERNILLYFIVLAPVIGNNLWEFLRRRQKVSYSTVNKLIFPVAVLFCIILFATDLSAQIRMVSIYPSGEFISPFRFPDAAVEFIKKNKIKGNIFNDIRYGGYLLWKNPEKKVFVDGRLIIRSPEFFAEYLTILDHPEVFGSVASRFDITHVLLPAAVFYRSMKLTGWLYNSPEWKLAFTDGASVLFVKKEIDIPEIDLKSLDTVNKIKESLNERWHDNLEIYNEACYNTSVLLRSLKLFKEAELVYSNNISNTINYNKNIHKKELL